MDAFVWQVVKFALFGITVCASQSVNQSIGLVNNMLQNYDKRVRPILDQSRPTNVSFSFYILNIDEFNEVEGRFSVSGVLMSYWNNELITWDPEDYGGIKSHVFSTQEVWFPELVMAYQAGKTFQSDMPCPAPGTKHVRLNTKDDLMSRIGWMSALSTMDVRTFHDGCPHFPRWMSALSTMDVRTVHDGWSTLILISLFQSKCSVDITYYPFDTQVCALRLISKSYDEEEMYVKSEIPYVDTSIFTKHGGWELIDNSAFSSNGDGLILTFKLERKPLFFLVNMILPIMLMSFLSSLVFALPPQSGERVSYGITVLLAIAVFLTLVGENLPKTSSPMSVLSYYLMFNLAISTTMVIAAILNLRVYFYDGEDQVGMWGRCIVRISCIRKCGRQIRDKTNVIYSTDSNDESKEPPRQQHNKTSWVDVSKAVDKLCIVCSLLVTVISNVSVILVIFIGKMHPLKYPSD